MVSAEEIAERVLVVTCERDDLLLRLNDYKMSKKNFEQELVEPHIILKAITAPAK